MNPRRGCPQVSLRVPVGQRPERGSMLLTVPLDHMHPDAGPGRRGVQHFEVPWTWRSLRSHLSLLDLQDLLGKVLQHISTAATRRSTGTCARTLAFGARSGTNATADGADANSDATGSGRGAPGSGWLFRALCASLYGGFAPRHEKREYQNDPPTPPAPAPVTRQSATYQSCRQSPGPAWRYSAR